MHEELIKRLRDAATMSDALSVLLPHSEGNAVAKLHRDAADAIEELSKPKWIPVTEALPESDQDVLVMVHWRDYPENMMCYGRKHKTRWYLWNGELGELIKGFDITHWMPLPQPPMEEE